MLTRFLNAVSIDVLRREGVRMSLEISSGFAVDTIPVRLLGQSNALPLCIVRNDLRGCAAASGRRALVPICVCRASVPAKCSSAK